MSVPDLRSVDEILASKSEEELRGAISRAKGNIAMIEAQQGIDDNDDWDGPFPLTKSFENWAVGFGREKVRLLRLGIGDAERELARRGLAVS
jgi:hypothetical protein